MTDQKRLTAAEWAALNPEARKEQLIVWAKKFVDDNKQLFDKLAGLEEQ